MEKQCKECNKSFTPKNKKGVFCCDKCRRFHWKVNNSDHVKSYNRQYVKTKSFRDCRNKRNRMEEIKLVRKQRDIRNSEKIKAQTLAKYYIKKRLECVVVGCASLGYRHHEDYSKPLDIIFLCPQHHVDRHKNNLSVG